MGHFDQIPATFEGTRNLGRKQVGRIVIEVDLYQRIRHLYTVQGRSQRSIARELGISRTTVQKYCQGGALPESHSRKRMRRVMTDQVQEWIQGYLDEDKQACGLRGASKQQHTAWRIYQRLSSEHGFEGSYESVVRMVRQLRPEPGEVFLPLAWDPGDALQVDWGQAAVYVGGVVVQGHFFCARLCYSAVPFVVGYPAERYEFLQDGHRQAFEYFQGVPRRVIYDNLRTVVKEGWGRSVRQKQREFRLLEAHYAFTSEFCNPGEGHEKGLVEGLVGWVRRNLLTPIPHVDSWDDLNDLLRQRCQAYLEHQIDGRSGTVGAAFEQERTRLLPLPHRPLETCRVQQSRVRPDSLVRVDNNFYSVPCRWVGHWVTVKAYPFRVEIWAQGKQEAQHPRSYESGRTLYNLDHYIDVLEHKPRAVCQAKPVRETVQERVLVARQWLPQGSDGDQEFVQILRLLLDYGQTALLTALEKCQACGALSYEAIRFQLLQELQTLPEAEAAAAAELNLCGITIAPTDLQAYDELLKVGEGQ